MKRLSTFSKANLRSIFNHLNKGTYIAYVSSDNLCIYLQAFPLFDVNVFLRIRCSPSLKCADPDSITITKKIPDDTGPGAFYFIFGLYNIRSLQLDIASILIQLVDQDVWVRIRVFTIDGLHIWQRHIEAKPSRKKHSFFFLTYQYKMGTNLGILYHKHKIRS